MLLIKLVFLVVVALFHLEFDFFLKGNDRLLGGGRGRRSFARAPTPSLRPGPARPASLFSRWLATVAALFVTITARQDNS